MPANTEKTREEELTERFREIEEKYTEDGVSQLGNAAPDELRELARLTRELKELQAARQREEATA